MAALHEGNEIAMDLTNHLYELVGTYQKGMLLKEFIAEMASKINKVAAQPEQTVYEAWANKQVAFPLNYPNNLKEVLKDSRAEASYTEYSEELDSWATASMDIVKKIGDSNRGLKGANYKTALLIKELAFLFNKDVEGIEGIAFIYKDYLQPELEGYGKDTIKLTEIHEYWKGALEKAQVNQVLDKQYHQQLITTYTPAAVEHFIDSMKFIYPSSIDVESVLSNCAIRKEKAPVRALNGANPDTLVASYTLNWKNRATLLEIAVDDGVVGEVPVAASAKHLVEVVKDKVTSTISSLLPDWSNSAIDIIDTKVSGMVSATLRTPVPADVINFSIPLKINKQYNDGKEVVFLDIGNFTDGNIKFRKVSPYGISRTSIAKVGKTEFRGTTAIHTIEAVIDISDIALSKAVAAGVGVAGGTVSTSHMPGSYVFTFRMQVVSTLSNEQLSATIDVESSSVDTSTCPLLEERAVIRPTVTTVQDHAAFQ